MSAASERTTSKVGNMSQIPHAPTISGLVTPDVGNIVFLEHINVRIADQRPATAFYVMGLGLTRDPYLRVGLDNMWINIGRSQFHLPNSGERHGLPCPTQRLRGTIGIVVPDLAELAKRLEEVVPWLEGTQFSYKVHAESVETTCPWGNRFVCHAPSPEFGETELALSYIEFDVPRGTAANIARFYREVLLAPAALEQRSSDAVACVDVGAAQKLLYHETDLVPPYDGHHIAIYVANLTGPHRFLTGHGLVIDGSSAPYQFNFSDIVDPDSGQVLFAIEHEVRCLKHPLYNRSLINRNSARTNVNRERGHDAFHGFY